jgi:hypothetical protein
LVGVFGPIAFFAWVNKRRIKRTRREVIDLIERALITGGDDAWDDFVSIKILDSDLEAVRQKCSIVNLQPKKAFDETLRQILAELRKSK